MNADFFTGNRQALMRAISAPVAVFAGHTSLQRSNDASYEFAQEANFWYLTGIDAADWRLVITSTRSSLIAPDVDDIHQIFDGSMSAEEAKRISGVNEVVSYADGEALITSLLGAYDSVASLGVDPHQSHYDFSLNPGPVDLYKYLTEQSVAIEDVRHRLASLRAIKQPSEIAVMRQAIDVTIAGFERIKKNMTRYGYEYEIEADFSHSFVYAGASGHAYDPIVAAGKNACTLHYGKNQAKVRDGDLVLLDIGASFKGYTADITRTYAQGNISDRQRAVHAAVEKAHLQIIDLLEPGLNVKDYSLKVDEIMQAALRSLGLFNTPEDYRTYFPHAISHGLGIDVHDSLGAPEVFLPGMVLTVEPGIYIPEEGIGVRIEDDILITEAGHENLSQKLPTSL